MEDPKVSHWIQISLPPLPAAEQRRLTLLAQEDDEEALDTLTRANLRFIYSIALEYDGRRVEIDDLVGEGVAGFLHGLKRFDPEAGFSLITYAVWWIRQAMLARIDRKEVYAPANVVALQRKVTKRRHELEMERERPISLDEAEEDMGISAFNRAGLRSARAPILSLDQPPYDDPLDIRPIEAQLGDEQAEERIIDGVFSSELRDILMDAMARLTEREQEVVQLYYGLGSQPSMTLEQIGQRLSVTRERVRQIRNRALEKLRRVGSTVKVELVEEAG